MTCPLCGRKASWCDCTDADYEAAALEERVKRLEKLVWIMCTLHGFQAYWSLDEERWHIEKCAQMNLNDHVTIPGKTT